MVSVLVRGVKKLRLLRRLSALLVSGHRIIVKEEAVGQCTRDGAGEPGGEFAVDVAVHEQDAVGVLSCNVGLPGGGEGVAGDGDVATGGLVATSPDSSLPCP